MKLIPVALAIFHEKNENTLKVWTQIRTDDGPFHGLLEFPGGGIEIGETPLEAVIREVQEEVGIEIRAEDAKFMGTFANQRADKTILLYVHLFPNYPALEGKGEWLTVSASQLSSPFIGKIPGPNHQIIDDLYRHILG